ncbi:major histocompatibility complex class I-related gene protein-like isoform X2 [Phycodurus eques]|uniref:major histocompatibility complex class I-related gene protein-like isoform X2 n=1 Tax=Phycodurus eques TaxID=693459 RepID=UPI002ACD331F|nr:major histocompatibility complex class I-related gene protein-like isoform X2 [Phycodurus eques]
MPIGWKRKQCGRTHKQGSQMLLPELPYMHLTRARKIANDCVGRTQLDKNSTSFTCKLAAAFANSDMFFFIVSILFDAAKVINTDTHSLMYIYTGLSEGAALPAGTHQFTAMGLLDGHVIDYYDSGSMKKVPMLPWMAAELSATYWQQGSQSRRSKQQWFKVNVDILLNRMQHNRSDVHILQWLHGCSGDLLPNGMAAFRTGVDTYSYDGLDFLSFDYKRGEWVATAPAALETKRRWDDVQFLKDYTRAYLDKECITWMSRYLRYQHDRAERAPPATVDMFARKMRAKSTLLLTCLASGFGRKDVGLEIGRNRRTLTKKDGVTSTGARPNEDGTFQRRDSVEVLESDAANFTCLLRHRLSGLHVEALWDHKILSPPAVDVGVAIGGGVAGLLGAILLVWLMWRKGKEGAARKATPPESVQEKSLQLLEREQAAEMGAAQSLESCGTSD